MMVMVIENRARKAFNEPLYVSYTSESQIPYRKHNLPRAAVTPLRCRLSALSDQTVGFPIAGRYQAMVPVLKTPYSGRTRASARSDRCSDQEFAAPREAPRTVFIPKNTLNGVGTANHWSYGSRGIVGQLARTRTAAWKHAIDSRKSLPCLEVQTPDFLENGVNRRVVGVNRPHTGTK